MQKIEYIKIEKLRLHPKNPRVIKDEQFKILCESIKENPDYFETRPILVNKKMEIFAGNMRFKAAVEIGMTEVPVAIMNVNAKKEEEIMLRDNRSAGDWDWKKLLDFDKDTLLSVGFEGKELDSVFNDGEEDKFNLEEQLSTAKKPIVKQGEIYQLGEHRLMCGDATKLEDLDALMGTEKAKMVFTDPPYNVAYKGRGKKTKAGIMGDDQGVEEFIKFSVAWAANMKAHTSVGGVFYVCSGWSSYPTFMYALQANGLYFSQPIVWLKNQHSMGWNDYKYKYEVIIKSKNNKGEVILYGWNGGAHYFAAEREECDVWEAKRRAGNTMVHPTQKPLALIERAIKNSSKVNDTVLDLFGGSGSTLIATEKAKRRAFILELDPKYVEIIINRWEAFTGKKAEKVVK